MTKEEIERKLKEPIPAAVAALTLALNEWAEVTRIVAEDGTSTIDATRNLEVLEKNCDGFMAYLMLLSQTVGLYPEELAPMFLFLTRRMLENTMTVTPEQLGGVPPWER